jgi:UDP-N-acetylmuramoyl-tripeptide--D-alanyl-D-alanine ligase
MRIRKVFKSIIVYLLTVESRLVLKKYRPKIVAITGSVGKTTTKDAVYNVLQNFFFTRKSDKSFNSELGLPLAILGCQNGWRNPLIWLKNILKGIGLVILPMKYPSCLALEIGADRPGDIQKISHWLRPDIVIVTKFGDLPVHIEFFKSANELLAEKSNLIKSAKENGLVILNGDDQKSRSLKELAGGRRAVTFGFEEGSDLLGSNYEIAYNDLRGRKLPSGINFKVNWSGSCLPVKIRGVVGRQHGYPVLAALALASERNLNMVTAIHSFENFTPPAGRMKLIGGIKNSLIIDDSYNSSPVALEEALKTLTEIKTEGKKIAIIGDMLELGKYSSDAHLKAGRQVAKSADFLITVGIRARGLAEGALENGMADSNVIQFDTSAEAGREVVKYLSSGDIILIKGSQGTRMEKVVEEIMAEPEKKSELLVRQDAEWRKR